MHDVQVQLKCAFGTQTTDSSATFERTYTGFVTKLADYATSESLS